RLAYLQRLLTRTAMRTLFTILIVSACIRMPAANAQTQANPDKFRPGSSSSAQATVPGSLEQSDTIVSHGTATFVVPTNMPGITVKGKSEALHARVRMRRLCDGVALDSVEASLPVKTLATGIALRDQHMRQYVFATASGEFPDLHFEVTNAFCPGVLAGREVSCKLSGNLSIRGIARSFSMTVKIREASGAPAFRAG